MPSKVGNKKTKSSPVEKTHHTKTNAVATKSRRPKSKIESKKPVLHEPTRDDVEGCVTVTEFSEMIECTFASLNAPDAADHLGGRQTPRIQVDFAKPLWVVSYTHEQEEKHVGVRAELIDVSADGLCVLMAKPIPVGAIVRFALADEGGEPIFGFAAVARTARRGKKYSVGVTFMDRADSLDLDEPTDAEEPENRLIDRSRLVIARTFRHAGLVARRFLGGHRSVRTITRREGCKRATFRVEAKLFSYRASLETDGNQVAFASWPIQTESKHLSSTATQPTLVELEGDGFRAIATVLPSQIMSCELGPGSGATGQRCVKVPSYDAASLNIDLGPPRSDKHKRCAARNIATPSSRR